MKFTEGSKKGGRIRSVEMLKPAESEHLEFNPKVDLSPDQQSICNKYLEDQLRQKQWYLYAASAPDYEVLFPGQVTPTHISPSAIAETLKNFQAGGTVRLEMVQKFLAQLKQMGQSVDSFADQYKTATLREFDRNSQFIPNNPTVFRNATEIIQLGWRTLEMVFPDREQAWYGLKNELEWRAESDDELYLFSQILVDGRILFPENLPDMQVTAGQFRRIKREITSVPLFAPIKILSYAAAAKLLTADELTINAQGQIEANRKTSLVTAHGLPERNLI